MAHDRPAPDPAAGRLHPYSHSPRPIELRYLLTDAIDRPGRPTRTVADLVAELERIGYPFWQRPSKAVSDALRTEVARGRVVRVGRGQYRAGTIPGSTRRRIRRRAAASRARALDHLRSAE